MGGSERGRTRSDRSHRATGSDGVGLLQREAGDRRCRGVETGPPPCLRRDGNGIDQTKHKTTRVDWLFLFSNFSPNVFATLFRQERSAERLGAAAANNSLPHSIQPRSCGVHAPRASLHPSTSWGSTRVPSERTRKWAKRSPRTACLAMLCFTCVLLTPGWHTKASSKGQEAAQRRLSWGTGPPDDT